MVSAYSKPSHPLSQFSHLLTPQHSSGSVSLARTHGRYRWGLYLPFPLIVSYAFGHSSAPRSLYVDFQSIAAEPEARTQSLRLLQGNCEDDGGRLRVWSRVDFGSDDGLGRCAFLVRHWVEVDRNITKSFIESIYSRCRCSGRDGGRAMVVAVVDEANQE